MVQCPHCGQDNPPQYRFCGMCGKAIPAATPAPPKQAAPVSPTPVTSAKESAPVARPKEAARTEDVPFSGPSFLGLSGGGSSDNSAEYLLEDEAQSSGHGKMVITLLLLLVAAGLLGWKWHFGSFPWQSASNAPATTTTTQNAPAQTANSPAENPSTAAANPTDSNNAQNSTAQNQAPQNSTPAAQAPAASAQTTDNSNAQPDSAAKTSDTTAPKSATPEAAQSSDQSGDNQAADKSATDQPKQTASVKPAPKPAPRRTVAPDEDSPESEAAALLTQGERYLNGNGVPQNCGRAQDSLRSAADRGNFQAVSDLATMYSTGHCVKKDLPTAYRWFVKALHQQPNNSRISTDLQVLWNQMSPEEKQVAMQK